MTHKSDPEFRAAVIFLSEFKAVMSMIAIHFFAARHFQEISCKMLEPVGIGLQSNTTVGINLELVPNVSNPALGVHEVHRVGFVASQSQMHIECFVHYGHSLNTRHTR
jgi:hypothetical protein